MRAKIFISLSVSLTLAHTQDRIIYSKLCKFLISVEDDVGDEIDAMWTEWRVCVCVCALSDVLAQIDQDYGDNFGGDDGER